MFLRTINSIIQNCGLAQCEICSVGIFYLDLFKVAGGHELNQDFESFRLYFTYHYDHNCGQTPCIIDNF